MPLLEPKPGDDVTDGPQLPTVVVCASDKLSGLVLRQTFASPAEAVMLLEPVVLQVKVPHEVPAVPIWLYAATMPMPPAGFEIVVLAPVHADWIVSSELEF
jgi:hypothetical protein